MASSSSRSSHSKLRLLFQVAFLILAHVEQAEAVRVARQINRAASLLVLWIVLGILAFGLILGLSIWGCVSCCCRQDRADEVPEMRRGGTNHVVHHHVAPPPPVPTVVTTAPAFAAPNVVYAPAPQPTVVIRAGEEDVLDSGEY